MRAQQLVVAAACAGLIGGVSLQGGRADLAPGTGDVIESLPSPAGPGSAEPNFAVARDGRVYLSWLEPAPDSSFALRLASFDGRNWSAPRTIRAGRDFFVNWADFPSIEVLADGRLAAHWLQRTGKSTYAYGVRIVMSSDGGATWGAPIIPHQDTSATEHGFVALWPDGQDLGAAWLDGRRFNKEGHNPSNEMTVMSRVVGGGKSAEQLLDPRACDCCQVTAAVTADGPIVAYRDRSADEIRDIYVVRHVNGKWTEPAPVYNDNWHIAACPVNGPSADANGRNVALAWFTAANDSARVKLAFSSNAGASFGSPMRVDDGAPGGRVDVQLLPDGSALVSWIERIGGDTAAVRARRIARDGRRGDGITVATSSVARASGFPRLARSGGHVFFAWTQPGRPSQVRTARLAISGLR